MIHPVRRQDPIDFASAPADKQQRRKMNGTVHSSRTSPGRKQRVTITLPVDLLERLRNAVYWKGHSPLARLITDALDDAVSQLEEANGGAFPLRLAPLKRGRPRLMAPLSSTGISGAD